MSTIDGWLRSQFDHYTVRLLTLPYLDRSGYRQAWQIHPLLPPGSGHGTEPGA